MDSDLFIVIMINLLIALFGHLYYHLLPSLA